MRAYTFLVTLLFNFSNEDLRTKNPNKALNNGMKDIKAMMFKFIG